VRARRGVGMNLLVRCRVSWCGVVLFVSMNSWCGLGFGSLFCDVLEHTLVLVLKCKS
jgi:hypothetical protein